MTKLTLDALIGCECEGDCGHDRLEDFFEANQMTKAERIEIFNALSRNGVYCGGGGAAPEFSIILMDEFAAQLQPVSPLSRTGASQ